MNLLDGSPRLDHAFRSCGQRRAHRCQPIILSAASDLKWPFNLFCAVQQLTWTRGGGVIGASVHSDYSVESISNGEMKHRQWCPLGVHLLNSPSYQTAGVAQQSPQVARLRRARSLALFPSQDPPPSRASSRRLLAPWQRSCRPIATARLAISPLPVRAPAAPEWTNASEQSL